MNLRAKFLRGGVKLSIGQVAGQGLSFVRNIIVARLVAPEDFGIAATFAITVSVLEMLSDFAADRLVIQDREGHKDEFLATVHTWQLGRGLLAAGVLLLLAWPLARLFSVPQAFWAFCWLPVVPLARGLLHLDIRRQQRNMRFWPWVGTEVGSQVLATAAAFPLAWWLRDYSAMLWVLLIRATTMTALSHLLAPARFRLAWDRAVARRLFAFGWPLLSNGLLLFAITQGDRALIGTMYSMEALGFYSVALVLAYAPGQFITGVTSHLFLPLLAAVQDDPARFLRRVASLAESMGFVAYVSSGLLIIVSKSLLLISYGAAYAPALSVFVWLLVAQYVRLARIVPITASAARADTLNILWSNVVRAVGVVLACAIAMLHAPLMYFGLVALFAEICAGTAIAIRLKRRHGVALRDCLRPLFVPLPFLIALSILATSAQSLSPTLIILVSTLLLIAGLACCLGFFPQLRAHCHDSPHTLAYSPTVHNVFLRTLQACRHLRQS